MLTDNTDEGGTMHYQLRITARADRDESCNLFTLTETFDCGIEVPSPMTVRQACGEVKQKFLDSWPHNRQAKPILVPLDVEIFDAHEYVQSGLRTPMAEVG